MSATTVHFSISGEFITEHVRNLWSEGSYDKAIETLECVEGPTQEQYQSVLFGRAKFTGINDLNIEPDNWTPPDDIDYPSMKEILTLAGSAKGNQEYVENTKERDGLAAIDKATQAHRYSDKGDYRDAMAIAEYNLGKKRAHELIAKALYEMDDPSRLVSIDDDHFYDLPAADTRLSPLQHVAAMARTQMMMAGMDPDMIPSVDALLNGGTDVKPTLAADMGSQSGWLLPDGKYYPCGVYEHIGVAETLLDDPALQGRDAEQTAEKRGWIKISAGRCHNTKKEPTKRQLSKLWDYSELHKKDYNDLIRYLIKPL